MKPELKRLYTCKKNMRIITSSTIPQNSSHFTSGIGRYLFELSHGIDLVLADIQFSSIPPPTGLYEVSQHVLPEASEVGCKRRKFLPKFLYMVIGAWQEVRLLVRLYRKCDDRKTTLFHAQRVGCEFQTIAARLAGFKHVITTVHNLPGEDKAARHWFKRIIEWLSFKCASHHICVSEATFDAWHKRVGLKRKKCSIIYNGMTPPDYTSFDRESYRAGLGLSPDTIAIGICARLHYMKGHDVLLKAFKKIVDIRGQGSVDRDQRAEDRGRRTEIGMPEVGGKERQRKRAAELQVGRAEDHGPRTKDHGHPTSDFRSPVPVRLLIAGSGSEEERLKALTADLELDDHVMFLGHRTDALEFANALDISVLPSVTLECAPYSLLESMFAGVPSVVSDVGGMKELIHASGGGKVVPAGDADALADALAAYIETPSVRRDHGRKAEAYAQQHLTAAQMAEKTVEVYQRFAAH